MEVFQILDILILTSGLGALKFSHKKVSNNIQIQVYRNQIKEKLNSKLAVMNIRF